MQLCFLVTIIIDYHVHALLSSTLFHKLEVMDDVMMWSQAGSFFGHCTSDIRPHLSCMGHLLGLPDHYHQGCGLSLSALVLRLIWGVQMPCISFMGQQKLSILILTSVLGLNASCTFLFFVVCCLPQQGDTVSYRLLLISKSLYILFLHKPAYSYIIDYVWKYCKQLLLATAWNTWSQSHRSLALD